MLTWIRRTAGDLRERWRALMAGMEPSPPPAEGKVVEAAPPPAAADTVPEALEPAVVIVDNPGLPPAGGLVRVILDVPAGASVEIAVDAWPGAGEEPRVVVTPLGGAAARPRGGADHGPAAEIAAPALAWLRARQISLPVALAGLCGLIYLITRLWALDAFPIYFYSDEANIVLLGRNVIARGFVDAWGTWLPMYFEGDNNRWTPVFSAYYQAIVAMVLGNSIFSARVVNALLGLLPAAALGLALRDVFKVRHWWLAVGLLAAAPAWFLMTRATYETVSATVFFTAALVAYLFYLERSPRWLYAAVGLAALSLYTFSHAQLIVSVAAVLLLAADWRHHWRHRRTVALAFGLAVVLAIPAIHHHLSRPTATADHLRAVASYWFEPITISEKLGRYAERYIYGLNPAYWFFPNSHDHFRWRMAGYAHLRPEWLVFWAAGVGLCLRQFRSRPHRAVLLATLAVPVSAALDEIELPRVLAFIGPAVLLIVLGVDWALARVERISFSVQAALLAALLSALSLWTLRDALVNGPVWFRDYGLYGLQYGARQIFVETLPEMLETYPSSRFILSTTWGNNPHILRNFFLRPDQQVRVTLGNVGDFVTSRGDLADAILLMPPGELELAQASDRFQTVNVLRQIDYPDGAPAFYFARLTYVDGIDAIFAAELAERRKPIVTPFALDGQIVTITHSRFSAGAVENLFDGLPGTLVRGEDANPLLIALAFPQPVEADGVRLTVGSMPDFTVVVRALADGVERAVVSQTFLELPIDPTVDVRFDSRQAGLTELRIEIKNNHSGEFAQIHVRDIAILR